MDFNDLAVLDLVAAMIRRARLDLKQERHRASAESFLYGPVADVVQALGGDDEAWYRTVDEMPRKQAA